MWNVPHYLSIIDSANLIRLGKMFLCFSWTGWTGQLIVGEGWKLTGTESEQLKRGGCLIWEIRPQFPQGQIGT